MFNMNKIAIVFWSGTGNIEAMANYIAEAFGPLAEKWRCLAPAISRLGN